MQYHHPVYLSDPIVHIHIFFYFKPVSTRFCFYLSGTRKKMLLFVIVGLTLTSFTYGENPAVQVTLTNKGLQYGKTMS